MDKIKELLIKIITLNISFMVFLFIISMRLVRSYLLPLILLIVGLSLVSFAFYKIYYKENNAVFQEKRRKTIEFGVKEIFKNCQSIMSFDQRRECLKDRMITIRKKNTQVKLNYKLIKENQETLLVSQDLGDLVEISKDPDLNFLRCSSNTFFLDWTSDKVYLSLENPFGSLYCKTPQNEDVYIVPSDLTTEQFSSVKDGFTSPIK